MPIIVGFVSQKGGVGKSTLARALAVVAAKAGFRVRIVDLDTAQMTCMKWNTRRKDNKHEPVLDVRDNSEVRKALAVASDVDLLILDGPARATMQTLTIAQAADVVVQPSNGHLDDLEPAVLTFHELVREGVSRDKLRMALSRVGTPTEEMRARAYVAQAGYECLAGAIYDKPAYGQAQDVGQAVIETRFGSLNEQADKLIESLLDAVIAHRNAQLAAAAPVAVKPSSKSSAKASAA